MQDGRKAVWSIPYVYVAFSKFKTEFYCISFFFLISLLLQRENKLLSFQVYSFSHFGSFSDCS